MDYGIFGIHSTGSWNDRVGLARHSLRPVTVSVELVLVVDVGVSTWYIKENFPL